MRDCYVVVFIMVIMLLGILGVGRPISQDARILSIHVFLYYNIPVNVIRNFKSVKIIYTVYTSGVLSRFKLEFTIIIIHYKQRIAVACDPALKKITIIYNGPRHIFIT